MVMTVEVAVVSVAVATRVGVVRVEVSTEVNVKVALLQVAAGYSEVQKEAAGLYVESGRITAKGACEQTLELDEAMEELVAAEMEEARSREDQKSVCNIFTMAMRETMRLSYLLEAEAPFLNDLWLGC